MARLPVRGIAVVAVTTLGLAAGIPALRGQEPPSAQAPTIQSLSEPGAGLAIQTRSPRTGLVTFASSPGRGIQLPGTAGAPAESRALAFVDQYGSAFGLAARAERAAAAGAGDRRARPGARAAATAARGHPGHRRRAHRPPQGRPCRRGQRPHAVGPSSAAEPVDRPGDRPGGGPRGRREASARPGRPARKYGEPRLEIFNRGMIDEGAYPTRLAWFVEATGEGLREFIWVDARTGGVLLNFSQLADAKNRVVHNLDGGTDPARARGPRRRASRPTPTPTSTRPTTSPASPTTTSSPTTAATATTAPAPCSGRACTTASDYRTRSGTGRRWSTATASRRPTTWWRTNSRTRSPSARRTSSTTTSRAPSTSRSPTSSARPWTCIDGVGNDTPGVRWLLAEDLSIGAIRNMMTPTRLATPAR